MTQKTLLMLLLALLGLSVVYGIVRYPRQQKIVQGKAPVTARTARENLSARAIANPDRVQLDLLTPADEPFSAPKKDLFGPLYRPVAPAPKPKVPRQVKTPAPPPPPPAPMEKPLPPLPRFTVLGSLEKAGEKQVFLALGSEVYLVKRDSRFGPGEKFSVVDMTDHQLRLRMAGEDRLITLPLLDKKAGEPLGIKRKASAPLREPLPVTAEPVEKTLPDSPAPQESPPEGRLNNGSVPYLKMPE